MSVLRYKSQLLMNFSKTVIKYLKNVYSVEFTNWFKVHNFIIKFTMFDKENMTKMAMIYALILINKIKNNKPIHDLFTTFVIGTWIGETILNDDACSSNGYRKHSGVNMDEFEMNQISVLKTLDYKLYVSNIEFENMHDYLFNNELK